MKKATMILCAAASIFFAACNSETKNADASKMNDTKSAMENKQERNKKIIMANMEAASKADVDAMLKDAAPDAVEYADGSIPPIKNLDSLKMLLKMMFNSIDGYKPENTMLVAEGDYVVAYANWTGTFKNDFMGIKATGKKLNFPDADIFKFNEAGKIIEHHSVQNLGAVLMASSMMK